MPEPLVRASEADDLAAIQAIYAHHVANGLGSFEEIPPTKEEMAGRREAVIARGLPWLVAEIDGEVAGFCYANLYNLRAAYRWTIEDSIYVAAGRQELGVGRALLATLIDACEALGYRQMVAIVGDSANNASLHLHASMGFLNCGGFSSVGFKHGGWVDIVFMQRPLGSGDATLPAGLLSAR